MNFFLQYKYNFFGFLITFLISINAFSLTGYSGFNLGYGYGVAAGTNSGDDFDSDRTDYLQFVAIGTTHEKGMYLGFRYEQQGINYGFDSKKQTAIGASLGIGNGGCYILAHYFWKINREQSNGSSTEGAGNGYDFGYQFPFFYKRYLTMGLQYSIRYYRYDDILNHKTTLQMPMLVIGGNF